MLSLAAFLKEMDYQTIPVFQYPYTQLDFLREIGIIRYRVPVWKYQIDDGFQSLNPIPWDNTFLRFKLSKSFWKCTRNMNVLHDGASYILASQVVCRIYDRQTMQFSRIDWRRSAKASKFLPAGWRIESIAIDILRTPSNKEIRFKYVVVVAGRYKEVYIEDPSEIPTKSCIVIALGHIGMLYKVTFLYDWY